MGTSKSEFVETRDNAGIPKPLKAHENPEGILGQFMASKMSINNFAENLRLKYLSGDLNPLEVVAKTKVAMKYLESIVGDGDKNKGITEIREGARQEAEKYGEKAFTFNGLTVELTEVGTRFDFKVCNDPIWNSLNEELSALKDKIKAREEYLKSIKEPTEVLEPDSGELVMVSPVVKRSTSSLRFTLS